MHVTTSAQAELQPMLDIMRIVQPATANKPCEGDRRLRFLPACSSLQQQPGGERRRRDDSYGCQVQHPEIAHTAAPGFVLGLLLPFVLLRPAPHIPTAASPSRG
jgi:hypothetical protein